MADRGSVLLIRIIAVVIALLVAANIVIAVSLIASSKPLGFGLTDVLVAPIVFVFYAGPALLVVGMASRSRTMGPALVALALAAFFAGGLVVYRLVPWNHRMGGWGESETQLVIVLLFAFWPLTAIGGLVWLLLHRRSKPAE